MCDCILFQFASQLFHYLYVLKKFTSTLTSIVTHRSGKENQVTPEKGNTLRDNVSALLALKLQGAGGCGVARKDGWRAVRITPKMTAPVCVICLPLCVGTLCVALSHVHMSPLAPAHLSADFTGGRVGNCCPAALPCAQFTGKFIFHITLGYFVCKHGLTN